MFIAGIDEAGRGPVLGPLVIAGVVMHEDDLAPLIELGLTDSKLMKVELREKLYKEILDVAADYKIKIIQAQDIDHNRYAAVNLNKIEVQAMSDILVNLKNWSKAYVDACDRNLERFQLTLRNTVSVNIYAEYFADKKYPIVSAASVIAKIVRDREIEKAHKDFNYDFGSGYPHDPKTHQFLSEYMAKNGELPLVARKSWETAKRIVREYEQTELEDFFYNAE